MDNIRENDRQDEVYTKAVKAGKRTYFFDIKVTRGNDHYLTITESKKTVDDGKETFQKHKLFLYKEDFDKFIEGLQETIDQAHALQQSIISSQKPDGFDKIQE